RARRGHYGGLTRRDIGVADGGLTRPVWGAGLWLTKPPGDGAWQGWRGAAFVRDRSSVRSQTLPLNHAASASARGTTRTAPQIDTLEVIGASPSQRQCEKVPIRGTARGQHRLAILAGFARTARLNPAGLRYVATWGPDGWQRGTTPQASTRCQRRSTVGLRALLSTRRDRPCTFGCPEPQRLRPPT